MNNNKQNSDQRPVQREPMYMEYPEEEEISLLEYVAVLMDNIKIIFSVTGVFVILGVVFALFQSPEYTSEAQVVREMPSEGDMSGLPTSALQSFGVNLGGGPTGLSPQSVPSVLQSREVMLNVAREEYYFEDVDSTMSYLDYIKYDTGINIIGLVKKYTVGLPGTIMGLFKPDTVVFQEQAMKEVKSLSESEQAAIESLSGRLSVNVDQESGVMTISITDNSAELAGNLCQNFIENLRVAVRRIYTKKTRKNYSFIKERFTEAEKELKQAENKLANFLESNQNPQSERLQTEIERLQRQVNFKTQLYTNLQEQLTQTEIDLEKQETVITVIEEPVIPRKKSGPNRKLTVILFLFLGGGLSIGYVFIKEYIDNLKEDEDKSEEIEHISTRLQELVQGVKKYFK